MRNSGPFICIRRDDDGDEQEEEQIRCSPAAPAGPQVASSSLHDHFGGRNRRRCGRNVAASYKRPRPSGAAAGGRANERQRGRAADLPRYRARSRLIASAEWAAAGGRADDSARKTHIGPRRVARGRPKSVEFGRGSRGSQGGQESQESAARKGYTSSGALSVAAAVAVAAEVGEGGVGDSAEGAVADKWLLIRRHCGRADGRAGGVQEGGQVDS